MKSRFCKGFLMLTVIALLLPALTAFAKDLPEERLVPPLGLLGTTADFFTTEPRGARLPYRIASPPSGATGLSSGRINSRSAHPASLICAFIVLPDTVSASVRRSGSSDFITAGMPPAR